VHGELRIVLAREIVELARAGDGFEHVREVGHRADRVGEGLHLLNELRVLDLVHRTGAVSELDPGLEITVALAGRGRFPLAGLAVQPFDQERLAAGAAGGRQVCDPELAAERCVDAQRGDRIDQRVEALRYALAGASLARRERRPIVVMKSVAHAGEGSQRVSGTSTSASAVA